MSENENYDVVVIGGVQATYDGHPLYTYIGDSGPGQANGNDLDLNGGFWYDIRIPR
jgi:predicted lipoprotein with Yx(FWY)xxD motif